MPSGTREIPPPPAPRFLVWKASRGHIPKHLEGEGGKLVIQGEFLKLLQLEQSDIALKSIIYGVPKRVMAFVVRAASNTRYNCVQLENSLFKINSWWGGGSVWFGIVVYQVSTSYYGWNWSKSLLWWWVAGGWILKAAKCFTNLNLKALGCSVYNKRDRSKHYFYGCGVWGCHVIFH